MRWFLLTGGAVCQFLAIGAYVWFCQKRFGFKRYTVVGSVFGRFGSNAKLGSGPDNGPDNGPVSLSEQALQPALDPSFSQTAEPGYDPTSVSNSGPSSSSASNANLSSALPAALTGNLASDFNFTIYHWLRSPFVFLLLAVCLLLLGAAGVLFFAAIDSDPVLLGTQAFITLGLLLIFCFFRL